MKNTIAYFGYGSLVNRQTLASNYHSLHPATLSGWRRHWQSRGDDIPPGVALLSVHEHDGGGIDGMLVIDHRDCLPELDEREKRYDRVRVHQDQLEIDRSNMPELLPSEIYLYVGHPPPESAGETRLIQSYLDTVLAGFLAEHGRIGIENFLATTIGFEREIIPDRHEPRYARAVTIDTVLADEFDELLRAAGVRFP